MTAAPGRTADNALAERLRAWGENDPDEAYFEGDVLACLLIDCGKASEALAQLQSDLAAARKERDEAQELADKRLDLMWMDPDAARGRAMIAEANLIALARVYGEACGELQSLRWLVNGTASVDDLVARLLIEAGEERRAAGDQATAAEREAASLRSQIQEAQKALRPFAACVFNDNGDVTVTTSHLSSRDWLSAKLALLTQEESR